MVIETERLVDENYGTLAESRIVYLILYVSDLAVSRNFYEQKLGLQAIEADEDSVKYDTGLVILMLNRASDYGITLLPGRHEFADIVFLVDDIDGTRAALEKRGVELGPAFRYDPGGICDFYDPDGHWLTLYEPNETAMGWASGEKIRTIWSACGRGNAPIIGPSAGPEKHPGEWKLDGKPLLYLFLFVRDPKEAQQFYNKNLGLVDLEGGPCSSGSGGDEEGVIKYDGGGTMLTTHRVWEARSPDDMEHPCPPRLLDPTHMGTIAVVFHVADIDQGIESLSQSGVRFSNGITRTSIGAIARFTDPSEHVFYLYEPSAESLRWPSGPKIEQILAAPV
jgi:catechol 2,3-dioxygenase-like lactoylglutathione lyase family enzyme